MSFLVMSYPFLPFFFCAPWDEGTTGVVLKESHFLPHQGLAKLRIWHCCHGRCVVVRRPKWLAVFLHFWMLLNSMWMDCHIIPLLDGATFYSSLAWNILYIYIFYTWFYRSSNSKIIEYILYYNHISNRSLKSNKTNFKGTLFHSTFSIDKSLALKSFLRICMDIFHLAKAKRIPWMTLASVGRSSPTCQWGILGVDDSRGTPWNGKKIWGG